MMRRSKREIKRVIEALDDDLELGEYYGRPDELTPAEKAALDELFDVDPRAEGQSVGQEFLNRLYQQEGQS